jgi:hypothetical protein
MKTEDGEFYCRPKEVERAIAALSELPANQVVARSRIRDPKDDDYVRTECLLHFVRRSTFQHDENASFDLFAELLDRVERSAVPELTRRNQRSDSEPQSMILVEVREAILEKFQDMLCGDRTDYDTRLDFCECKFNAALATLRLDKREQVSRRHKRFKPIAIDEESNDPSIEIEEAYAKLREPQNAETSDFLYRLKVQAAINSLPAEERQVIELLDRGLPIESQDPQVLSIVKVVGCVEKTVRNRRNRAIKKLLAVKEESA